MLKFNGVAMMMPNKWEFPDKNYSTDSCLTGIGGICDDEYFHWEVTEDIEQKSTGINDLEIFAILVALRLCYLKLKGKNILIYCGNKPMVNVINRGATISKMSQYCVREIVMLAALNDFQIKCVHIKGKENRLSDLLSRWHMSTKNSEEFRKLTGEKSHQNKAGSGECNFGLLNFRCVYQRIKRKAG